MRRNTSCAISGVYLDGLPIFLTAMGASLPCDGATPWLVVVLGFAGRLGGLVSGMVNPYSYAGQCNWLRGLDSHQRSSGYEPDGLLLSYPAIKVVGTGSFSKVILTESSPSDYCAPTLVF